MVSKPRLYEGGQRKTDRENSGGRRANASVVSGTPARTDTMPSFFPLCRSLLGNERIQTGLWLSFPCSKFSSSRGLGEEAPPAASLHSGTQGSVPSSAPAGSSTGTYARRPIPPPNDNWPCYLPSSENVVGRYEQSKCHYTQITGKTMLRRGSVTCPRSQSSRGMLGYEPGRSCSLPTSLSVVTPAFREVWTADLPFQSPGLSLPSSELPQLGGGFWSPVLSSFTLWEPRFPA